MALQPKVMISAAAKVHPSRPTYIEALEATIEPPPTSPTARIFAIALLVIWEVLTVPLLLVVTGLDLLLWAVPFNRLPNTFHLSLPLFGTICPLLTQHQSVSYWLWRWIVGREPFYHGLLERTPTPDESPTAAEKLSSIWTRVLGDKGEPNPNPSTLDQLTRFLSRRFDHAILWNSDFVLPGEPLHRSRALTARLVSAVARVPAGIRLPSLTLRVHQCRRQATRS